MLLNRIKKDKMLKYLRENSNWYVYLINNPNTYKYFKEFAKKKYRLGFFDRANDIMDNIVIIDTILKSLK